MTNKQFTELERSRNYLADRLDSAGRNVLYANIRHVSASGMTRKISFYLVSGGELVNVTYHVARVTGYKVKDWHGHNVISVNGCGMDMAFAVTSHLSGLLFGDDYHIKSETI